MIEIERGKRGKKMDKKVMRILECILLLENGASKTEILTEYKFSMQELFEAEDLRRKINDKKR
jgi:hypothetical protein